MITIGLTGSIAMGKSTVARIFSSAGLPCFDSDQIVHQIYEDPRAVNAIEGEFPGATANGIVDRKELSAKVWNNSDALSRLEDIVHPLVAMRRAAFVHKAKLAGLSFIVLDIPLLFETKAAATVDVIIVVSATAEIQRARALARPGMTEDRLNSILRRQWPDALKRRNAHRVIDTTRSSDRTIAQVYQFRRCLWSKTGKSGTL